MSDPRTLVPTTTEIMNWEAFAKVPAHQRRRITEKHAKKMETSLDGKYVPALASYNLGICRFPNGKEEKANGHTRVYNWKKGVWTPPPFLTVNIHNVENQEESNAVYDSYDLAAAADCAKDRFDGAMNECNIKTHSVMLNSLNDGTLRVAYFGNPSYGKGKNHKFKVGTHRLVRYFAREIEAMDQWGVNKIIPCARASVGVLMAHLAAGSDEKKLVEFARAVSKKEGVKLGREMCGAQAFNEMIASRSGRGRTGNRLNTEKYVAEVAPLVHTAVSNFLKNKRFELLTPSPTSFRTLLEKVHEAKGEIS